MSCDKHKDCQDKSSSLYSPKKPYCIGTKCGYIGESVCGSNMKCQFNHKCAIYKDMEGCFKQCSTSENCRSYYREPKVCEELKGAGNNELYKVCLPSVFCASSNECTQERPLCVRNVCELEKNECSQDADCSSGMICDKSEQKYKCKIYICRYGSCKKGFTCVDGTCLKTNDKVCSTDSQCNYNEYCMKKMCVELPCSLYGNDCLNFGKCQAGSCIDPCHHKCAHGQYCNNESGECSFSPIPTTQRPTEELSTKRPAPTEPGIVIQIGSGCDLCDIHTEICEQQKCIPNFETRCAEKCDMINKRFGIEAEKNCDMKGKAGGECRPTFIIPECSENEYFVESMGCIYRRPDCSLKCKPGYKCNMATRTCEMSRGSCDQINCPSGDYGGSVCTLFDL